MIAIIDYDAGNIRSVEKAFDYIGEESVLTRDPKEICSADHVVLPGGWFVWDSNGTNQTL
ncbi:glutamine amidotransferase [Eubacterium oxidoreducens]|uniref:Glutamine amidotransferase n=1 Tax=Eubacterium oxidoreducens TaxID=1732 RepID=A0A1G6AQY4_EUBOX|nr:glutamine amidotransferase [Eubacterium oxidoreducens]